MKITLSTIVLSFLIVFGAFAQGSEAMIKQLGNSHDAIIEQVGFQNSATTYQKGNNNSFLLNQIGSHDATIEQARLISLFRKGI